MADFVSRHQRGPVNNVLAYAGEGDVQVSAAPCAVCWVLANSLATTYRFFNGTEVAGEPRFSVYTPHDGFFMYFGDFPIVFEDGLFLDEAVSNPCSMYIGYWT